MGELKINKRRKRAIEKAQREMDKYGDWKEHVVAVGGTLIKDKDGRYRGILRVD